MTTRFLRMLAIAGAVSLARATSAAAQCAPTGPPLPAAIKGSLIGVVTDPEHNPLEDVDVVIRNPRRQAKTRSDGRFRIDDLKIGIYEVTVRRIGYEVTVRNYEVTDTGGVARFCLIPEEPRGLPAMVTSVPRGGLSGVIGDTAYGIVSGAEIRAIGEGVHTTSDSTGAFSLPLKPGKYAIGITKPGYTRQLVGVTVPDDSGRRIAVWLAPASRNANRQAADFDDMRVRIMSRNPNRSALLTREELGNSDRAVFADIRIAAKANVKDDCEAIVDGSFMLPLYMIDKRDIEFIEVYIAGAPRRAITSINGNQRIRTQPAPAGGAGGGEGCGRIYVWTKP